MKKKTFWLIAICCFVHSWHSFAQFTFPSITGPTTVAQGAPYTENVNDINNSELVPAGLYDSFSVSVDWTNISGSWSSEADLTVTTSAGSVQIDPPTSGAGYSTPTTLTFNGYFTSLYDPSVDGYLDVVYNQSFNGSSASWANIVITLYEAPTCPNPTQLSASNITSTSADLAWVSGNTETLWDIQYGMQGFTLGEGTTIPGVASSPYSLSGLTSATSYQYYVRADCGAGDVSVWEGPFSFTSLCDVFSPDYCENFSTAPIGSYNNSTVPNCWTFIDPTPGNYGYGYVNSSAEFYMYNSSDLTGDYILVGPNTTGLSSGNYRIKFDVKAAGTEQSVIVGTMDGNTATSTFTAITTINMVSTAYENHIVNIPVGTDQYLAFKHGQDGTYDSFKLDNICVEEIPSCIEPYLSTLTASNITSTSADLGWTESDDATMWDLEVVTVGTTPTGTPTATEVNTNSYSATGLTSATDYDFYVRANCGVGDVSAWTGPYSFTTLCDAFTPDYCEDFSTATVGSTSNNTVPNCWAFIDATPVSGGYGYVNSSGEFYMYNASDSTGDYILVGPNTTGLSSGTNRVTFDVKAGAAGKSIIVGTIDGNSTGSTFTEITTITLATNAYENHIVNIPLGADGHIAFKHGQDGTYDNFRLDNICVEPMPACPEPLVYSFTASNITSSSADLGWTESGSATLWDIEIVAAGTTPTGMPTATAATNPYSATTLTSATDYEFYVRSICGTDETSIWSGPYSFTTLCAQFTPDFCEDFGTVPTGTSSNTTVPNCWTFIDSGSGYGYVNASEVFYMYNASHTTGDYILVGPNTIGLSSGANRVTFDVKANGSGQSIIVGTMDGNTASSTFTEITTIALTTTAFESHIVNIPVGTDEYIAFKHGQDAAYDTFNLDNICLEPIPSCPSVTLVEASNILANSADISWTAGNTETLWNIEYGPTGFTLGSGTPVSGVTNPYTLSGLTSQTEYDVYVQADCTAGDLSTWSDVYSFSTACDVMSTLPVCEDFSTAPVGSTSNPTNADCWSFVDSGAGYGYVSSVGGQNFYMSNSNDAIGDYILVSPAITNVADGTNRINLTVDGSAGQTLIVGTMSSADNTASFSAIETVTLATSDSEVHMVNIPVGTNTYVAIKHGQEGIYDSYYFNSICIEPIPSCPELSDLTTSTITENSVELSWTNSSSETTWNIEYGTQGFVLGSGLPNVATSNPFTLTGLLPSTSYDVYVQAVCGEGDLSAWAGPLSFTTACGTMMPDYLENFSTYSSSVLPNCWEEANDSSIESGPAIGNGAWSSDGFLNNGSVGAAKINLYSNVNNGDWLISPYINLSNGNHELKFDLGITTYSGTTDSDMGSDDELKLLITTDEGATWTTLMTWDVNNQPSNTGSQIVVDLSSYNAEYTKFAFWATEGTVNDAEDYNLYVDNFEVVALPPACSNPSELTVANITDTSADLSWLENGNATSWDIEVVVAGTTPTGTPTNAYVTSNPYTVTGLLADVEYEFYVLATCDAGISAWVGPFSFTTNSTLGINENEQIEFSYYPNPVENVLNLNAQNTIDAVIVLNVLGQQVVHVQPNSLEAKVDMTELSEGAYFVKVTMRNATKTIRVLKK
ncbi:fibronectin type III domain-containing protein [Mangrovimonas aestuarii]|uniref:fibronectin type III domain-containing protein n=1 Tax=Mangrovimonas aestuarii TaxID=3018443 RepID=UPI002379A3D9|nr:fibronectin type III domain-containing protein [Mangrovimonas aestuarii]